MIIQDVSDIVLLSGNFRCKNKSKDGVKLCFVWSFVLNKVNYLLKCSGASEIQDWIVNFFFKKKNTIFYLYSSIDNYHVIFIH